MNGFLLVVDYRIKFGKLLKFIWRFLLDFFDWSVMLWDLSWLSVMVLWEKSE